ncbi:TPA: pyridoxal 5'-phosphate synthase glutaminase subunit PdxT [Candidatus Peregrinibacteria bacterium]|nr:pyridoxal 5'-phosphate synthase glutaminase subunit PdxT [Candidatus Peregrinibacteria bacterium]
MSIKRAIIGVLALQGGVIEHQSALEKCGVQVVLVKTKDDLKKVQALIIPGGESTTIGKLIRWYGLEEDLKRRIKEGMPVYGTCAGAILLAKNVIGREKAPHLALMDVTIERNSYGRQLDSFESQIEFGEMPAKHKIPAVFIRAPKIRSVGNKVIVLAQMGKEIIAARENNKLVTTFHPELTDKLIVHRYFLDMIPKSLRA